MKEISIMINKLALFEEKEIRKIYKNNKWYFSIIDIISNFTDYSNPTQYIKNLKLKDSGLQKDWNNICILLNMQTSDGKVRKVMTTDTVGALRIIESIQTEKAEPIKKWLAKLGYERIEEISNPELLMDRMKQIYESKGYSKGWIEQREREISTRHSLKDEWESRGIKQSVEYILLTNEIYKSSFDINIDEYQKIKGIKELGYIKDSMTNLELALINLGEVTTAELHNKKNSRNINALKEDIAEVGKLINNTKKEIENKLEKPIISSENYMNLTNNK